MDEHQENCCYCHRPLNDVWKMCNNCGLKCHMLCGWYKEVKKLWNGQDIIQKVFQCWTCHTATLYTWLDDD